MKTVNDVLMQHFIQLISTNTGLHIREQDRASPKPESQDGRRGIKVFLPLSLYGRGGNSVRVKKGEMLPL